MEYTASCDYPAASNANARRYSFILRLKVLSVGVNLR